jgi:DNA-binding CsgD family transcriptional regulator
MHLVNNRVADAFAALEEMENAPQSRATRSERLAVRALGLLLDGRMREALASAHRAHKGTTAQAMRTLANLVIGMIASESESCRPRLPAVISSLWKIGQFDALVLAYRTRPTLLLDLATTINEHALAGLISRARDRPLARTQGIAVGGADEQGSHSLSPREREVSALLAQGRTNAEIARALYISEVTVKVHVRHILQKLGVRNRAEAAVLVATQTTTQMHNSK